MYIFGTFHNYPITGYSLPFAYTDLQIMFYEDTGIGPKPSETELYCDIYPKLSKILFENALCCMYEENIGIK